MTIHAIKSKHKTISEFVYEGTTVEGSTAVIQYLKSLRPAIRSRSLNLAGMWHEHIAAESQATELAIKAQDQLDTASKLDSNPMDSEHGTKQKHCIVCFQEMQEAKDC